MVLFLTRDVAFLFNIIYLSVLNGIKVGVFFQKKKTSKESTCAVTIRIIITFENHIYLQ